MNNGKNNLIYLIFDDNEIYLDKKVQEIAKQNNISNIDTITKWQLGIGENFDLFGNKKLIHLKIRKENEIKKFTNIIDELDDKWYGDGVVITSTYSRGSKKIEDLVKKSNGIILNQKKTDIEDKKNELLKNFPLSNENKNFIKHLAGQDYDLIFTLINSLKTLPTEKIKKLTLMEIYRMFPDKKGSIPPWDFLNELFKEKNIKKVLKTLDRTLINTHILVVITLLSNKFNIIYKSAMLSKFAKVYKMEEQQKILGLSYKGQLWDAFQITKKLDIQEIENIGKEIYNVECNLKGSNTNLDPTLQVKLLLTKIHNKIHK